MKKNGFAPVMLILVVAIIGVVGYFGYRSQPATPGFRNFTTSDGRYSIDYPSDWILTDKSKWVDYEGGFTKNEIEIAKGKYVFNTLDPSPNTPSECLFNNEESMAPSIGVVNYDEVAGNDGKIYRIGQVGSNEAGNLEWVVCQGRGDLFDTVSLFGNASFETPSDYEDQYIDAIKNIIVSLKTTKSK